jgi:hypothetical protein
MPISLAELCPFEGRTCGVSTSPDHIAAERLWWLKEILWSGTLAKRQDEIKDTRGTAESWQRRDGMKMWWGWPFTSPRQLQV